MFDVLSVQPKLILTLCATKTNPYSLCNQNKSLLSVQPKQILTLCATKTNPYSLYNQN